MGVRITVRGTVVTANDQASADVQAESLILHPKSSFAE